MQIEEVKKTAEIERENLENMEERKSNNSQGRRENRSELNIL